MCTPIGPVEDEWQRVLTDIIIPLEDNLDGGIKHNISSNLYTTIFTLIYRLCTASDENCAYIYEQCALRIRQYLEQRVAPALRALRDEQLLEEFVRRRINHGLLMEWYHKVFNYLSKHITKAHRDPLARSRTSKAIPKTICDMAYSDIIFNGLQNEIAHSVLQLVERRRIGQEINTDTLKSAINVFKDENIYEEMLEASIISYSKKDFHSKGMSWIATDSTPEFLLKVDQQIEEVKSSVRLYLPPSTEPKMLHALNSEILAPYTNILSDKDTGCLYLLNRDCNDDLRRMFRLFSKVGADHLISESFRGFLASLVEAHVKTFKEEITSSGSSSSAAVKDLKEKEVQAGMKLVPALIELLEKYSKMVKETFDGTASFQKALKDAFSVALRSNGNSQAILNALVTFCDTILKKQIGGSEENQSESQLDFAVSLLAFMEDKDYFVEVYRTHLSKRIQRPMSEHSIS